MTLMFNLPLSDNKDLEINVDSETPITIRSWDGVRQTTALTKEETRNMLSLLEMHMSAIKQSLEK